MLELWESNMTQICNAQGHLVVYGGVRATFNSVWKKPISECIKNLNDFSLPLPKSFSRVNSLEKMIKVLLPLDNNT